MTRFLTFLSIVFLAITLFSCQSEAEEKPTHVIITIQAEGEDLPETALHLFNKIGVSAPDETGFSKLTATAEGAAYYTLRSGRNSVQVFLVPGDSIHLELDWTNVNETIQFSGDRIVENEFLLSKKKVEEQSGITNSMQFFSAKPDDFYIKMNALLLSLDSLIRVLDKSEDINEHFALMEKKYPEYGITYMGANYVNLHSRITGTSPEDIDFPAEEARQNFLNLDNTNIDLLPLPIFRTVLAVQRQYIWEDEIADSINEKSFPEILEIEYATLEKHFQEEEIIEFLKFDYLNNLVRYSGPGDVDPFYEEFIASARNEHYKEILSAEMDNWKDVMPGTEVPDFEFETPEGELVNLSDLRGKLLYIDVWATWCGPCLREHPYWDELVEEYSDQDITFLAVSIDNTRDPWEKMLSEKDLKGKHWFAPNAWGADFVKHFNIGGIPRFILLDADGKVIQPSTDRPSGKIRDRIDQYLADSKS